MYQIDNASASASQPASTAPGTPGFFTDGVPASSIPATVLPGEWCNAVMLELLNVLKAAGMNPSKTTFNQLAAAIQSGAINYAPDAGAANAYAVTLANVPAVLLDAMRVTFAATNANSGASTLNLNGLGAKPIYGLNAQPLQGGEILAGSRVEVRWNAALGVWVLLNASGGAMQMGAGSYGVTAAQFDKSTMLATDAFVQRALGNLQSTTLVTTGPNALTAAQAGNLVWLAGSTAYATTLPPLASVPGGAVFKFFSSNSAAPTLAAAGSDLIYFNGSTYIPSVTLSSGDTLTLVAVAGQGWAATDGTVGLVYAPEFAKNLANPGWQKLPSGLMMQWGTVTTNGTTTITITFPIAFPHGLLSDAVVPPDLNMVAGQGATTTTRTYTTRTTAGAASASGITFDYIALGW